MRALFVTSACLIAVAISASAQRPTFHSRTDLVVLSVTVADKSGAFVPALPKESFTVRQDGKPRGIVQFSEGTGPVRVVVAVDASRSMQGQRMDAARLAVVRFLDQLGPADQLRVIGFNDKVFPISGWTTDRDAVAQAMTRVHPTGATALYDAVVIGVEALRADDDKRQALVIVSDGFDATPQPNWAGTDPSDDHFRSREARAMEGVDALRLSETLAYAVATGGGSERVDTFSLKRFTDPTGGTTQYVSTASAVAPAVERIARELRAQYVIGFEPAGTPDGKFHKVDVSVSGCSCIARTRNGFVARK